MSVWGSLGKVLGAMVGPVSQVTPGTAGALVLLRHVLAVLGPEPEVNHWEVIGTFLVMVGTGIQAASDISYGKLVRVNEDMRRRIRQEHPRRFRDHSARHKARSAEWERLYETDPTLRDLSTRANIAGWAWVTLGVGAAVLYWASLDALPDRWPSWLAAHWPAWLPDRWASWLGILAAGVIVVIVDHITWPGRTAPSSTSAGAPASSGAQSSAQGSSPVTSEAHAQGGDVRASVNVDGQVDMSRRSACASASVTVDGVTASAEARIGPETAPPVPPAADA